MSITYFALALGCLALGGILKGATGAGAPIVVVPALAMLFDAQFAVAIMILPNLLTNVWQAWIYRRHHLPWRFLVLFTGAGGVGVVAGSYMLASLPQDLLSVVVALAVFLYVGIRFLRPDWVVDYASALRLSLPVGLVAGLLQGASGISAPASLSFLNAMRLERETFISTVAVLFLTVTAIQLPALGALGVMTPDRILGSAAALVPIVAFMPVGAKLAERFSRRVFDNVILGLLAFVALKLVADSLL
ncbi:TSUP family transporter [Propylenella binzhouense]|uniref:Probable membrane transporter protein n=1 Tax=Propylenella binzhouense TaxID=2555902 RepID=A0A964WUF1_9HYPH|nr:sulfite exporter TauE/SafE family protein [Propylenella binzhouense]